MPRENQLGTKVLAELLPGRPRRNHVISLLTVGDDGYPNVCLLSPYQVVAIDAQSVLFAVYGESKTSANLERRGNATLLLFLPPAAYCVKGDVEPVSESPSLGSVFRMKVVLAKRDYYSRAPITSTVTFEKENVLPDYSRVFHGLAEVARKMA